MQRWLLSFGPPVGKDTHIFLQTTFTAAGFAHYATTFKDQAHNFVPVLFKKVYNDKSSHDWQVWHFHGDLPFAAQQNDHVMITSEWVEVD